MGCRPSTLTNKVGNQSDGRQDRGGYSKVNNGLLVKMVDFRRHFLDKPTMSRPKSGPDKLYFDKDFPHKLTDGQKYKQIEWKRPKEIRDHPKLFTSGASRSAVGQGSVSDCWFMSVVANIADNQELIKQVFPKDAYFIEDPERYDGVFHARLFNFGKWTDVYTDDYLPIVFGNHLMGAKSKANEDEMWVALLEKAFAKLHGSYDGICGGQSGDAFLELTGGIGETIEHKDMQDKPDVVFDRINNALMSGRQITGSVPVKYHNVKGLIGNHAYSIIGAHQLPQTKVIRVRNPWGRIEWTGAWSEGSSEWKQIPQNSTKLPEKTNGEFLMSLADFMKYFENTTICSIFPDFDMDGRNNDLNHVLHIYGEWFQDSAAGFKDRLMNPRFSFTVTSKGARSDGKVPIFIQMIQQQAGGQSDKYYIRCDVLKIVGKQNVNNVGELVLEQDPPEVYLYSCAFQSCYRCNLDPGQYVIIPGTQDKKQERAFLLRIFSSAPLDNVQEIPHKVQLLACKKEEFAEIRGKKCFLTYEKLLSGKFISGVNAGGQISHRKTFATNPQYLITIPKSDKELPVVIHVMQKQIEPQHALGIRMYKVTDDQQPPLNIDYLYEDSKLVPNTEGQTYKFVRGWDCGMTYLLTPGNYVALLHLDTPDEVKEFFILLKSIKQLDIRGFQTGAGAKEF